MTSKVLHRLFHLCTFAFMAVQQVSSQQVNCGSISEANPFRRNLINTTQRDVDDVFSSMPSDLPVRKIYVHGRPVYVRQVVIEPARPIAQRRKRTIWQMAAPAVPNYPQYPAAQYQQLPQPYYNPSSQSSEASPVQQQNYYPQQQSQSIYVPAVQQQQQSVLPYQTAQAPTRQLLSLPPPPSQAPQQLVPPEPLPTLESQPQYPLSECYTDDSNFMCCNSQLEHLMKDTYNNLVSSSYNFNRCNVQKMANTIEKAAEERFNTTFEVIAGVGDYASKSNFFQNYICKIELEGRYLLAYASPKPDIEEEHGDAEVETSHKESGYRASNHIHSWR